MDYSIVPMPLRDPVDPTSPVVLPSPEQARDRVLRWQRDSAGFAALVERYGSPVQALRHLGLVRWSDGNFGNATEAFLCGLALTADVSHLWRDLAGVYEGWSDTPKAEYCIRKAIELDPHQSGSWLVLGNLAKQRNDPETAENAYRHALALDPVSVNAHFGLGVVQFDARRHAEATASFRAVIALDPAQALGHACLGHVLYAAGDFVASAAAFEAALGLAPLDVASRRKRARARTLETMIAGHTATALDAYVELAGEDSEAIDLISRDSFALLSAYGQRDAAIDVGEIRLAESPDDPIRRYLLDAVRGQPHTRAPAAYVEAYFDQFAPEFDHKLVEVLRYEVPKHLRDLVAGHRRRFADMLDLGCGTGLAAEHLASFGGRLTGVDLSARMLEQARKRGRYAALVQADAVAFMCDSVETFDLLFAADLLVYIGDLAPFIAAASASLRSGGLLGLSIETSDTAEFVLLPSGRFAHSPAYLERLTASAFESLDNADTMIRLEAGRPVDGKLLVLRRR